LAAGVVEENHRSSMPPRFKPEGVEVIGMQFEAFAGLEERARHPARRQPQQSAAIGQGGFNQGRDFAFDNFQRSYGIHIVRTN
jgi:hypothetical protein